VSAEGVFRAIESTPVYLWALLFFAIYPVVSSIMWTSTASAYWLRREFRRRVEPLPMGTPPRISVIVPTYCEELHIEETLEACLALDYPDFEVVVVDDGSTDGTVDRVMRYVRERGVRLIAKRQNEGKAMALNDAIHCVSGEIVFIIDADAAPEPECLRYLAPHFASPRVAAVTANPRVVERDTLLEKMQTMEFTSIVSILRRAQRVWGRVLTVSGVSTAFRRAALYDVGLFSPDMTTEDIDLTWKLQKRYYDVRYEPGAVVWMRVPRTPRALWQQRRRWARGLIEVLRRHGPSVIGSWKRRRMWPVMIEAILSITWAYCFVGLTAIWITSYAVGHPPVGASPIPNWWGMVIATLSVMQLTVGALLDSRYERGVLRALPVAVLYPLVYWMFMALVTVMSTPRGLRGRRESRTVARWRTPRDLREALGTPEITTVAVTDPSPEVAPAE
jgi:poly-beta-1,6-N-acetyl-D-glucosamine synthase